MIKLYFSLTVKDQNGKVRKKITKRLSHSFTKQFLLYFEATTMHRASTVEGSATVKDTGGVDRTFGGTINIVLINHWSLMGAENLSTYGIVVGKGTNAESVTDYALQTQCTHGVGADQFQHARGTYVPSIVSGSDVFFSTLRTFQNASGNTITVTEIGIYMDSSDTGSTHRYVCLARDLLAAGVAVLNGEILTVQYTFKTTN
jgi:hypothetical protein